jgi:secreted Zn-dependent insulinase-like peptidase
MREALDRFAQFFVEPLFLEFQLRYAEKGIWEVQAASPLFQMGPG